MMRGVPRVLSHRRKRLLLGNRSDPSYALSTFTTNDWDFTADNVDDATDTLTVYNANGALMTGASVVFTSEDTFVDAATCTLATDQSTIDNTTGEAVLTAFVLNAAGTPLPGIPAASLSLASTGTGNTITAFDTVTDRNGRFRWTFSSTVSEAKTLTLTAIGIVVTDTVAITVGVAPSITLDFFSDWATQSVPATSLAAQQDTILGTPKWDFIGGSSACEVVDATGLGFPAGMANVVDVPYSPATFSLFRKTGMAIPAVGEHLGYRWYMRCDMPTSDGRVSDWSFHPVQDGQAGSNCNWAFEVDANHGTQWVPWFFLGLAGAIPYPFYGWFAPALDKGKVYRFEILLARTATGTFTFKARIFDESISDVVPLYDESDFSNQSGGTPYTLDDVDGNVPTTGDFPFNDVDNLDGLNGGTNDTYTLTPASPQLRLGYQGGFARAFNQGWIGAYPQGAE